MPAAGAVLDLHGDGRAGVIEVWQSITVLVPAGQPDPSPAPAFLQHKGRYVLLLPVSPGGGQKKAGACFSRHPAL